MFQPKLNGQRAGLQTSKKAKQSEETRNAITGEKLMFLQSRDSLNSELTVVESLGTT